MLQEVLSFMNYTGENDEFLATAQAFYQIINILLERNYSVINTKKVILLQELVKTEALLWGSLLTTNTNYAHVNLSSLALHIALLENALYKLHLNTSSWFSYQLDVHIEGPSSDAFGNGTFSIAVIVYRDLSEFLPLRYVAKLRDGNEMEFEINSRMVTVEVGRDGQRYVPSQGVFHVDLEFEHTVKNYSIDEWNISCGVTNVAATEHSWDFSACTTQTVGTNLTRCRCNQPGTYAALLTARPTNLPLSVSEQYHTVVLVGCVCCLVQAMFTLFLLLPYWWHHKTCLIFLKLQCCTATSGAMGVFIYAVRDSVPKASFPYVTTSLEAFLLIGMSSHLSKLLIVYTEVIQIPKVQHMKQTVVSIITGVPVLAVLCNHLAHHSTGWQLQSWWLLCGTMLFNIFIASAVVMLILFVFLYFTVMRRLNILSSKNSAGSKAIGRRTSETCCYNIFCNDSDGSFKHILHQCSRPIMPLCF
ncbi:adhesion G protein-coupled receptor B2-like isoform X2 [Zootermopsis nevadensis]|uniref:adhesion G protein-coupled receptor B2-like isoform X2 n=1 Tax=Zootermopsis nevadensis TaxID=136037 RepID=UPI000B8E5367|nr:adhesion G protein-coupled receptor B2-like isoform X2 [Zootermopsis nevadensis]